MKKKWVFYVLCACIGLAIILSTFSGVLYNKSFYSEKLGNIENAEELNDNILGYYQNKNSLSNEFNEREQQHLQDVKKVVKWIEWINYLLVIIVVGLLVWKRYEIEEVLICSGLFSLGFILLFSLIIAINFGFFFDLMHKLLFTTGSWMFDPAIEILTRIYPISLFTDFGLFWVRNIIISSLLFIIIGITIKKFKYNSNGKK